MSTKISTEMHVSRPTTRRMAPPGGLSTVFFGGDPDQDAESVPVNAATAAAATTGAGEEDAAADAGAGEEKAGAEDAVEGGEAAGDKVGAAGAGELLVSVCVASNNLHNLLLSTAVSQLVSVGVPVENISVFNVAAVMQLPLAAQQVATSNATGSPDAILALGVVTNDKWHANAEATAVLQGLTQASLQTGVPIVQGVIFADNIRAAKTNAGDAVAQFAASTVALAQLKRGDTEALAGVSSAAAAASGAVGAGGRRAMGSAVVSPTPAKKAAAAAADEENSGVPETTASLLRELREGLKNHGARGIAGLARKFKIMDDDESGELDFGEFCKAIGEHTLGWSSAQCHEVFDFFDEDRSGTVNYDEFLVGVRGELNPRRAQLVLLAFDRIDADHNGFLEIDDIVAKYDASKHPDVVAGKRTKNEIFREFLDTFDGGEKDGKVTPAEFMKYYCNVSASIDDDDYFELMIRNAWHISGGEGQAANTTCRRVLVTKADGTQSVEEIKDDLGINADDKDAMIAKLREQGIDAAGIETFGSVDNTSAPSNTPPRKLFSEEARPASPASTRRHVPPGGTSSLVLG